MEAGDRYNYRQIINHPVFKNVDFNSLMDTVPPYVLTINSIDDTSNFSDVPHRKSAPNIGKQFERDIQRFGPNTNCVVMYFVTIQ